LCDRARSALALVKATFKRRRGPIGPTYAEDFADPFVLRTADGYVAYATQTGDTNVQVMTSADLVRWDHLGDALPQLPQWAAAGHTWSPCALERDGKYVLYYVVRHAESGRQSISVATADGPHGPFVDSATAPFVFQLERGGSIDPSPFVDTDGVAYLLWKSEDNALGQPSSLWAAPLSVDGLSLTASPTRLLDHDRGWEAPLIEAPSMVSWHGVYFLFYSANWWESPKYCVGYATAPAPLGPWEKATKERPWLMSEGEAQGPGGQEFFTDRDGALRMAYHAWVGEQVGYAAGGRRALWLGRVAFRNDRPVLSD
jgi:beta-xylosidase